MPGFEVVLRLADGSGRETRLAFALEPGQQVLFGRSPEADIVIPDQNRKVSSRHGRIVCQPDGSLRGYDLASLNGTYLHGSALDTETGGLLADGDKLRVGDFELLLAMTPATAAADAAAEPDDTAPPPGSGSDDAAAVRPRPPRSRRRPPPRELATGPLLESLERAYAASLQQDAASRDAQIGAALATGLASLPGERRELTTAALLDDFSGWTDATPGEGASPATVDVTPAVTAPVATGEPTASPSPSTTGTVDHLQLLALRLVPGIQLADAEQRARFMTLLAQVVEATLDWLARGLEGRAVFGQEFGAEVTLVFQRSTNPLKGMSRDELKRFLLDWTDALPPDSRRHYLDGVLEDLHDHQVGVLAGVEEAVTGVLTRLSPERVEGIASQQKAKGWTAAARSWQTYCQLHQELAEERTKLFHELISPAIQKGYLHRHGDRNGDAVTP